jgi:hypothetical protein
VKIRRRDRGSALVIIVVLILIMIALSSAYVGSATTMTQGNRAFEYRLQARYVAIGGLNRALAELNASASETAVCSHSTSSAEACFGNIDGNIKDARITANGGTVANMCTAINTATGTQYRTDTYNIDTGATAADSFPDFKGQTSATPFKAISETDTDGSYTVRCQTAGSFQGGIFPVYKLRTYGVWKGEVVGYECYATRVVVNPFDFAAFGDVTVSGGGSAQTRSYKSGYPPDAGTTYVGPPAQYVAGNAFEHNGDVGSNGTVTIPQANVDGTITSNAGAAVPPPISPTPSGTDYGDITNSLSIGSAGTPTSGNYQIGSVSLASSDAITLYPESGKTLNLFVRGPTVRIRGQASFTIKQPTSGLPGTVKIWFDDTCTDIDIAGQGVVNTDTNSSPGMVFLLSAGTADFNYTGGSELYGVIYAPTSTAHIGGGGSVTGSVIAKTVAIQGNPTFTYDLSLRNLNIGAQVIYKVSSLVEIAPRQK